MGIMWVFELSSQFSGDGLGINVVQQVANPSNQGTKELLVEFRLD
jgi:hypothetical protein